MRFTVMLLLLVVSGFCAQVSFAASSYVNQVVIKWQRLLIENDQTCPRCGSTEQEVEKGFQKLRLALLPLGIKVSLEKGKISSAEFAKAPLESNRIWINGKPLEGFISASVGQSPCCEACGTNDCRTITVQGQNLEVIPAELIIKAGLKAAAEVYAPPTPAAGCPPSKSR